LRGTESLSENYFPLSFEGEGDKGGKVTKKYLGGEVIIICH